MVGSAKQHGYHYSHWTLYSSEYQRRSVHLCQADRRRFLIRQYCLSCKCGYRSYKYFPNRRLGFEPGSIPFLGRWHSQRARTRYSGSNLPLSDKSYLTCGRPPDNPKSHHFPRSNWSDTIFCFDSERHFHFN